MKKIMIDTLFFVMPVLGCICYTMRVLKRSSSLTQETMIAALMLNLQ